MKKKNMKMVALYFLICPNIFSFSLAQYVITDSAYTSNQNLSFDGALSSNFKAAAIVSGLGHSDTINDNNFEFKNTVFNSTPSAIRGKRILGINFLATDYNYFYPNTNNIDYSIKNNSMLVDSYKYNLASTWYSGIDLLHGEAFIGQINGEINNNSLVVQNSEFSTINPSVISTVSWDGITSGNSTTKKYYGNFSGNSLSILDTSAMGSSYTASIATVSYSLRQNTINTSPDLKPINDPDGVAYINVTDNILSIKNSDNHKLTVALISPSNITVSPSNWENGLASDRPHQMRGGNFVVNSSNNRLTLDGGDYTGTYRISGSGIRIYSISTDHPNAEKVSLDIKANNNTVILKNEIKGLESASLSGSEVIPMTVNGLPTVITEGDCSIDRNCAIYKADLVTGNTLELKTISPIKVRKLSNFENLNFYLKRDNFKTKGDEQEALLTVTDGAYYGNDDISTKVSVKGIEAGKTPLSVGEKTVLIDAETKGGNLELLKSEVAMQGVSLLYNVDIYKNGNKVIAEIAGQSSSGEAAIINPAVSTLLRGRNAALVTVVDSQDLIIKHLREKHSAELRNATISPFVILEGGRSKYGSSSNIKLNTFKGLIGLDFQYENLLLGAFFEAGRGSYSAYDNFDGVGSRLRSDGRSNYFGLGLFGYYKFDNNFYVEASLRGGRSKTKFESYDLVSSEGLYGNYNSNVNYIAGHVATGYVLDVDSQNQIDFSLKYIGAHLGKDSITVAGDPIKFDNLRSNKVRLTADWRHQFGENLELITGAGYEYEFSGKVRGTAYQKYAINELSIKGNTGIVRTGLRYNPQAMRNMNIDFNIQASFGKRKGVDGTLQVRYDL